MFGRPNLTSDKSCFYEEGPRSSQTLNEMHRFYEDKRFCDIILCVDNCQFSCHRLVLAASSIYFERMFSNGMSEASASKITISNVSAVALKKLIEFSYTSTLSVSREYVLDLFEAADMLQFNSAKQFCQDFLTTQIDQSNCLNFMMYAYAFNCDMLYERAKICAAQNFKKLRNTEQFFNLPFEHFLQMLCEDHVDMEYEEHVYQTMLDWVKFDQPRVTYLPQLLEKIRLNFISSWFLENVIDNENLIKNCSRANNILAKAKLRLSSLENSCEIPWHLPASRHFTGLTEKIVYLKMEQENQRPAQLCLYDPGNKSWSLTSRPCPLAYMYICTSVSTCVAIGNVMIVIGGWDANMSCKSMNPGRGAVSQLHEFRVMNIFPTLWYIGAHPMGISRYLHSSIAVSNKIYLFGGLDETQSLQATVYAAEVISFKFDVCPRMLYPVCRPALAAWDQYIFVMGGFLKDGTPVNSIQVFDVVAQKWHERASMGGLHTAIQYAACFHSLIYVLSAELPENQDKTPDPIFGHALPRRDFDTISTYCPMTQKWQKIYQFDETYSGNYCITQLHGLLYISGGLKGGKINTLVECYCPESNQLADSSELAHSDLSLGTTLKVMHENFGL